MDARLSCARRRLCASALLLLSLPACGGRERGDEPAAESAGDREAPVRPRGEADAPGPEMAWVPGGRFLMGSEAPWAMPNEGPTHAVEVTGFWMDRTPVTNREFAAFVASTGYVTVAERPLVWEELAAQLPPGTPRLPEDELAPGSLVFTPTPSPVDTADLSQWWTWVPGASWQHPEGPGSDLRGRDEHPVVHVGWDDAVAYAAWAGKRLPTEAEWESACLGGQDAGRRFPWGDELRPGGRWQANVYTGAFPVRDTGEDGFAGTSPVRAFPANALGLYDLPGNVWEWTATIYRADAHVLAAQEAAESGGCCFDPQGPSLAFDPSRPVPGSLERVIKGGSYLCHASYCESYRASARRGTPPDTASSHVGFRCVRDGAPP